MASTPGGIVRRLLILTVAVIVTLGLGEIALRGYQWMTTGSASASVHQFDTDPASGLRIPVAGARYGHISINRLGFRGPEIAAAKPPDTLRIAFLGGSTTFCAEVSSNETTWPHAVWQTLCRKFPGTRLEYVNAGVPGYTLTELITTMRLRVAPLRPDVVVIYEAANDISRDTRRLAEARGLWSGKAEDPSWLARHSVICNLVEKNYLVWSRQRAAVKGKDRLTFDPAELSKGFRQRLTDLVELSRGTAPLVVLVTFSTRLRREQSPEERLKACNTSLFYMPYMSIEGILDAFSEYNRVIREVAAATGALLVEGEDSIPADAENFNDSVHFKDAGCAAQARRVVDALAASAAFQKLVSGLPPR